MVALANNFDTDSILASDVNGLVVFAPKGTAAPATTVADWPTGWTSLGLITDDGVTLSYSKNTEDKTAWNAKGVVKRIPKTATLTLHFTAYQTNVSTHKLFFGSTPVAGTGNETRTDIVANSDVTEYAFGVEFPYTAGNGKQRLIIPRGVITDLGDIQQTETNLMQYEMTVGAQVSPGVTYLGYWLSLIPALVPAA